MALHIWQQPLWLQTIQSIEQNRLPHALLCQGAAGLGKEDFVKNLCQYLLCQHTIAQMPCGKCQACHLFLQQNHPDFHWIGLQDKSKSIKVDQIRQLIHQLSQSANQGGYRLAVITPAATLNIAASNALLKLLEEPGNKTVILLITERPAAITATIRSRCQLMTFQPVGVDIARSWLTEQGVHDQQNLLLQLSQNAPLLAKQLADSDYLQQREAFFKDMLEAVGQPDFDLPTMAQKYSKQNLDFWLQNFNSLLNDVQKCQQQIDTNQWQNQDCINKIQSVSQQISIQSSYHLLKKLYQTQEYLLAQANLNLQLVIEGLINDWGQLIQGKELTPCG